MQLGFVSAILPELSLEEVVRFAAAEGFQCVELMCWPRGKAERRYAGVTHLDVAASIDAAGRAGRRPAADPRASRSAGWAIIPIRSSPTRPRRRSASSTCGGSSPPPQLLGVGVVNTFVGRDPRKTVGRELAALSGSLAAAGALRRGARRADRHRELPDVLHRRRMARRQEPGHSPADLAADVRRDSQPVVRAELRPVAPRLAADGLHPAAGRVCRADLPRASEGRPGRPRSGSTTWAFWPRRWSITRPSCRAAATSTGRGSSRPWRKPATRAGLHRSGRPRLRRLARGPAAGPARERRIPAKTAC